MDERPWEGHALGPSGNGLWSEEREEDAFCRMLPQKRCVLCEVALPIRSPLAGGQNVMKRRVDLGWLPG